jgi:4-amino-4-deoxy-L-arabinose transferase-like glycosyltransferase
MRAVDPLRLRDLLLIVGLGVLVMGAGLELRDPWPADEPVFTLIARDMLASGNWLIPMVGGDYFQDKPPLLFWLQAAGHWLTGSERVGFLLPSLLAGLGTLLLIYDLGRRLWTREAGLYAALLLLITVQFTLQSRRAQQDALLMFFTVLSAYCLLRQLLLGGGWRWAVAAGVAAGFGVLTKVVGFFSFMVLVPWLYAVCRRWPGVAWLRPWPLWLLPGLACVLVVAAWLLPVWLLAQQDQGVRAYLHELVFVQTFGRYVDPWHHYQPVWYYLRAMALLWLPLVLLLPWLIPRWRDALRARDARVLLPLGFSLLYVGFFTLSRGKRDVYILSALPMLALSAGFLLPQLLRLRAVQFTLLGFTALICLGCAATFGWFAVLRADAGARLLVDAGVASFAPLVVLAAAAMMAMLLFRLRRAHLAVLSVVVALWLVAGLWVMPQMDGKRSARQFIARLEMLARPDRELGLLAYHEHFLLHLTRSSVNFGHRRFREPEAEFHDAAAWLAAQPERQLLVQEGDLDPCFKRAQQQLVGDSSRGNWYLVTGAPDAGCVARGNAHYNFTYSPPARD